MDGETLAARLSEVDNSRAISLFHQILDGASYLLSKGFILGDFKLDNVLTDKELNTVKIDDLEYVIRLSDGNPILEKYDIRGEMINLTIGSDKYSSPEQERNDVRNPIKSLVYSLGCGLYYLITGEIGVFRDIKKFNEADYNESLSILLRDIDQDVATVLKRCLAYNPDTRFESLSELKNELLDSVPLDSALFDESLNSISQGIYVDYHDNEHFIIRDTEKQDVSDIASLLKKNFTTHNVLSKDVQEVEEYIRNSEKTYSENGGGFIVCEVDDEIEGLMLLRINDIDRINGHIRVTYNHFTSKEGFDNPDITQYMVCAADKKLDSIMRSNNLKTAKVGINLAPQEVGLKPVLEDTEFKLEGVVEWKYRPNEDVLMFGKVVDRR